MVGCLEKLKAELDDNKFVETKSDLSIGEMIEKICFDGIISEPCIWPHFGLVSIHDSGSHKDMDYPLLIKSAKSITPFFHSCFEIGRAYSPNNKDRIFVIRRLGMNAESEMLKATGNINTHKGIIFLLGILCVSLGEMFGMKRNYCSSKTDFGNLMLTQAYHGFKEEILNEIKRPHIGLSQTYGEWVQYKYGIAGIRGLVTTNFKIIREGFRLYVNLFNRVNNKHLVLGYLRVYFLANCEDTNIIKRAGIYNANKIKLLAKESLTAGGVFTKKGIIVINELEEWMLKNQWSAAAAGDLVIIILFMVGAYESGIIHYR